MLVSVMEHKHRVSLLTATIHPLTRTDSDRTNVSETSFWEIQCELKVGKKEKRVSCCYRQAGLQTVDRTDMFQCGLAERTRMADRADVVSHSWRELPRIPFLSRQTFCRLIKLRLT